MISWLQLVLNKNETRSFIRCHYISGKPANLFLGCLNLKLSEMQGLGKKLKVCGLCQPWRKIVGFMFPDCARIKSLKAPKGNRR